MMFERVVFDRAQGAGLDFIVKRVHGTRDPCWQWKLGNLGSLCEQRANRGCQTGLLIRLELDDAVT